MLGCEVGEARQEDRSFGDPGREKFPQYRDLYKQAEEFRLHLIHLKKSLLLSLKYRGT